MDDPIAQLGPAEMESNANLRGVTLGRADRIRPDPMGAIPASRAASAGWLIATDLGSVPSTATAISCTPAAKAARSCSLKPVCCLSSASRNDRSPLSSTCHADDSLGTCLLYSPRISLLGAADEPR